MKPYYLIGHDGSVRPGKASIEDIADALGARESYEDRLAVVSIEDGEIVATPLTPAQLDTLRGELDQLRKVELVTMLDHVLAAARIAAKMRGTTRPAVTIMVEQHPWAEDIVRDWGAERGLYIKDKPMPATGKTWIRTCELDLGEHGWFPTVVTLQWPLEKLDGPSLVARDAELDGRPLDQVEAIRSQPEEAF